MWKLIQDNRGATIVEFALVILPVLTFMIGIIQTGYVVWVDNLLHIAVDTAARCAAIQSTTSPCAGPSMLAAANAVFAPLTGASFISNTANCSGAGLVGTYTVTTVFVSLNLTAQSCYP